MAVDISDPRVFWNTRLAGRSTTFGTGEKEVRPPTPPEIIPERDVDRWVPQAANGKTIGRLRVAALHGGLMAAPESGVYDPLVVASSTKKPAAKYSLGSRHNLKSPRPNPAPNAYNIKPGFVFTKPYVELMSRESARNEPMVRNRHLGPGTYEVETDSKLSRYERVLDHKLKPKTSLVPRQTIAYTNLYIKTKYNTDAYDQTDRADSPGPGEYGIPNDPSKIEFKKTFGARIKDVSQKEIIKPGPGDYLIENANAFGGVNYLSLPNRRIPLLKPLVNPSADPDTMTDIINKKVWKNYKSEYSFPKKVLPRSLKGRVFYSTVQNMPQYHAGKHSSGAHIKTERR